jgi:hypothetical protein
MWGEAQSPQKSRISTDRTSHDEATYRHLNAAGYQEDQCSSSSSSGRLNHRKNNYPTTTYQIPPGNSSKATPVMGITVRYNVSLLL